MSDFTVPLYLRGEVIEDQLVEFGTRHDTGGFRAPNPHAYIDQIPLSSPHALQDLYEISFDEILDVLAELGSALDFEKNKYIQQAYEASLITATKPAKMLKNSYERMKYVFDRNYMKEIAEARIGINFLEGWVPRTLGDGRQISVRAFGARSLHIPAGNGGVISAITIIRNAITRSDAIIKAPSNDPLTAIAIARTLAEIAPNHPLSKHLAVGYWKGGDEVFEQKLYKPENIEKIIAWGGFSSIKHVTKYIQPGLELISLDPKRSATIIGSEAFINQETMQHVAARAACDIGMANQEACASARVIYVLCGTDADAIDKLNQFGEMVYQAILVLPDTISSKPKHVEQELYQHIESTKLDDTFYRVIGGDDHEGAIIVSQFDEPIDYSQMLAGRVANLVPVDSIDKVTRVVNAYTQTVGIYPESLKAELRNHLPLFGAQRLTSLGYACNVSVAAPQDAIEPLRRMCKWIIDETCEPAVVTPMWENRSKD